MYILITALFTGGVLAGALALRSLGEEQLLQLNRYFGAFIESFHDSGMLDHGAVFRQALSLNFRHLLLTWFMGLFLLGFPVIAGLVGLRGFSLGFTVGFLVQRNSLRGALFAAGAVLPHNLLLIPTLIVGSVTAFSFSWLRLRCSWSSVLATRTYRSLFDGFLSGRVVAGNSRPGRSLYFTGIYKVVNSGNAIKSR